MTSCNYLVLEYASSELQARGASFAAILYLEGTSSCALRGLVLPNWETALSIASESEIQFVREFLEDVHHYTQMDSLSAKSFFERIADLNVGPIRTFVTGRCAVEDLEANIGPFFSAKLSGSSLPAFFQCLHPVE
jgi:hypothetical protein